MRQVIRQLLHERVVAAIEAVSAAVLEVPGTTE
jgi:hypothetical protein